MLKFFSLKASTSTNQFRIGGDLKHVVSFGDDLVTGESIPMGDVLGCRRTGDKGNYASTQQMIFRTTGKPKGDTQGWWKANQFGPLFKLIGWDRGPTHLSHNWAAYHSGPLENFAFAVGWVNCCNATFI